MKSRIGVLVCLFVMVIPYMAAAQSKMPVSEALDFWVGVAEQEITAGAQAMPEEKYSFVPKQGEFAGVRTFGQQIKHLAANNYRMAAYVFAQTPPPDQESETGPETVQTKAQIVEYLQGSFAELHRAAASLTEENMLDVVREHARQKGRMQFIVDAVVHSFAHYGQMVEYLRMNSIVPPESRK